MQAVCRCVQGRSHAGEKTTCLDVMRTSPAASNGELRRLRTTTTRSSGAWTLNRDERERERLDAR